MSDRVECIGVKTMSIDNWFVNIYMGEVPYFVLLAQLSIKDTEQYGEICRFVAPWNPLLLTCSPSSVAQQWYKGLEIHFCKVPHAQLRSHNNDRRLGSTTARVRSDWQVAQPIPGLRNLAIRNSTSLCTMTAWEPGLLTTTHSEWQLKSRKQARWWENCHQGEIISMQCDPRVWSEVTLMHP